jgi:hypothetical protein
LARHITFMVCRDIKQNFSQKTHKNNQLKHLKVEKSSVVLIFKRTIPTELPPSVGQFSANFRGQRMSRGQRNESPRPLISVF